MHVVAARAVPAGAELLFDYRPGAPLREVLRSYCFVPRGARRELFCVRLEPAAAARAGRAPAAATTATDADGADEYGAHADDETARSDDEGDDALVAVLDITAPPAAAGAAAPPLCQSSPWPLKSAAARA